MPRSKLGFYLLLTRILESVCYPHQIFHIPIRHRSAFLQQRYGVGIFRILHPVGKATLEIIAAASARVMVSNGLNALVLSSPVKMPAL